MMDVNCSKKLILNQEHQYPKNNLNLFFNANPLPFTINFQQWQQMMDWQQQQTQITQQNMSDLDSPQKQKTQPQNKIQLFDSPRQSLKQDSMFNRFKFKQINLKNKFKDYIFHQKFKYPLTTKHLKTQQFQSSDDQSVLSLKQIRQDKKKLIQGLQHQQNQTHYLETKRKEKQQTFSLLKNKYERVNQIRSERKKELVRLQKSIKTIEEEIKQEKRKYKHSIDLSKQKITQSRMACEQRKNIMGKQTRKQKQILAQSLALQKHEQKIMKISRRDQVRSTERQIHRTLSKVKQFKKNQANQAKLQKLLRQLAQKQQIKIASSRMEKKSAEKKKSINRINKALENKITHFRTNLAEKRLTPQKRKIMTYHKKNPSFTEEGTSTYGGFFSTSHHNHNRSYTESSY